MTKKVSLLFLISGFLLYKAFICVDDPDSLTLSLHRRSTFLEWYNSRLVIVNPLVSDRRSDPSRGKAYPRGLSVPISYQFQVADLSLMQM